MNRFSSALVAAALGAVVLVVPTSPVRAANSDAKVKYHRIDNKDVPKEVPKDVLATMNKYTKDAGDLLYQRQERDGKTFYSVHYTPKEKQRTFIRVDDKGKVVVAPEISDKKENATPIADASKKDPSIKREAITTDDLPAPVRKTVEQQLAAGGGHTYIRETKGKDVSYVVEYSLEGERTSARIAPDGKMLQESPIASRAQTETAKAPPTPTPVAAPTPTPQQQAEAQLAAAKEAAAKAPYQVLSGVDQLPAEVRAAAQKELATGTEPIVQRFTENGQTIYGIHFTGPQGGRRFMAIDGTGKVITESRKSGWQEGGKGMKYAVVDGGALPAEVRKVVETNGGSEQIYVSRTNPKGQVIYLVQWTAPGGERMETEIAADGKVTQKAGKAEDQPQPGVKTKSSKK